MSHLFDDNPDLKNIYTKMLEWLSQGEATERRLIDRIVRLKRLYPKTLRYQNYTRENAETVVTELRRAGLVDDRRYAERLFELLKDKRDGLKVIRRKMLNRGVPALHIDDVFKSFQESGKKQDLACIIQAATLKFSKLQARYGEDPKKKYQIRPMLYAWLSLRGYTIEESAEILKNIEENRKRF